MGVNEKNTLLLPQFLDRLLLFNNTLNKHRIGNLLIMQEIIGK